MPDDITPEDEKKIARTQEQQDEPEPSVIPPAATGSDGLQGAKPGTVYSPGEGVTEEEAARAERGQG
jgi:hypothetical protein